MVRAKIHLAEKGHFFLFIEENMSCGYSLGASNKYQQKRLKSTQSICFLREIRKNESLIIWILFLATTISPCPRTSKLKFTQRNGTSWTTWTWCFSKALVSINILIIIRSALF